MADAWATLIDNSTLTGSYDAWEHLNAQGGGEIIYLDRYISDNRLNFKVEKADLKFDFNTTIKFNIEPNEMNFTKEYKTININQKEAKITFKAKRVID